VAGFVIVVLGVTLITFVISHQIPGDPARLLAGPRASPQAVQQIRAELGLDQPVLIQYGRYLNGLAHGDLGTSIVTSRPVLGDVMQVLPATLELVLTALLVATILGVTLGALSAVYRDRLIDQCVRLLATLSISVPSFWFALVLLLVFYGTFDLLPGDGRLTPGIDAPTRITGLYLIDALITGNTTAFKDALAHIVLPAATLAFASIGGVIRLIRSSMIEVLQEDYIRTAMASGLRWRTVVFNHALRNSLLPFITVMGLELGSLLFGSVVVEMAFAWPGVGAYVLNAIFSLDFPAIMGFTVVVSIAYVLINALVDLLYRAVNPRLRDAS
jgi:peptide/nickel transport system permease protein